MLRHLDDLIRNAPAHQPEIAGVHRDIDAGDVGEQTIKGLGRSSFESAFAGPAAAHSVDHVGFLAHHEIVHRAEQLRGILKVGVDHEHQVATHRRKSGRERELVTVIARQPNGNDIAVLGRKLIDELPGVVGRSVVDKNQLKSLTAQRACGSRHLPMKFAQALLLVATGHNDRQKHPPGMWHPVLNFHDC